MNKRPWMWLAVLLCGGASAQSSPTSPVITLGITLPAVNSPATVAVLVTDPALSLVPTGQVTVDFGDSTPPVALQLSTTHAATTHTYTSLGQFNITATYSGDANFLPGSRSLTTVSIAADPVYTLYTIGDSITGGQPGSWPVTLMAALGWPRVNDANAGFKTQDDSPAIYGWKVDSTFASTWLLGQNDGLSIYNGGQSQFEHAALAENAWMAIPEGKAKVRAQNSAVAQSGPWSASDIYPTTGLHTISAGSSLSATVPGSTIYVGLTSLLTTNYTVDVLIDGIDQGRLSPVSIYTGAQFDGEPFGSRYVVGGDQTANHTVEVLCVDPGTSGCYVDWIGGNGGARPNLPPYVFTGVSYTTLQAEPLAGFQLRQGIVRRVEGELESDGLAIRLADIAARFSGPELPQCLPDQIHPAQCAADILETVWLSSMSFLATEAQRIDFSPASATVGVPVTLRATATSGLLVTYKIVSGSGQISGDQLTATNQGTIVVEADQAGSSTVLPAAPAQANITVVGATLTVTAANATRAYGAANPAFGYIISGFVNGDTQASSVSGTPLLSTTASQTSPGGQYAIIPSLGTLASSKYSFTSFVNGTLTISDYALVANPGSLAIKTGQSGSLAVTLTPLFNYQGSITLTCGQLPAHMSCTSEPASLTLDGSGAPLQARLTIHTSTSNSAASLQPGSNAATGRATFVWMPALAGGLLLLANRRRLAKQTGLYHAALLLTLLLGLAGPMACGTGTWPDAALGTSVINVTGTTAGANPVTHSVPVTITVN